MGAGKMTRSFKNVLDRLSRCEEDEWTPGMRLPNGNGHCSGVHFASGATLRDMREAGLIEYGKAPKHSLFGYRITPAGRLALENSHGE